MLILICSVIFFQALMSLSSGASSASLAKTKTRIDLKFSPSKKTPNVSLNTTTQNKKIITSKLSKAIQKKLTKFRKSKNSTCKHSQQDTLTGIANPGFINDTTSKDAKSGNSLKTLILLSSVNRNKPAVQLLSQIPSGFCSSTNNSNFPDPDLKYYIQVHTIQIIPNKVVFILMASTYKGIANIKSYKFHELPVQKIKFENFYTNLFLLELKFEGSEDKNMAQLSKILKNCRLDKLTSLNDLLKFFKGGNLFFEKIEDITRTVNKENFSSLHIDRKFQPWVARSITTRDLKYRPTIQFRLDEKDEIEILWSLFANLDSKTVEIPPMAEGFVTETDLEGLKKNSLPLIEKGCMFVKGQIEVLGDSRCVKLVLSESKKGSK